VDATGVPHAVANLADQPCRFLTVATPSGIEDFFRAQHDYLASLGDTPFDAQAFAGVACGDQPHPDTGGQPREARPSHSCLKDSGSGSCR
jgi:hypothetical protein